MTHIDDLRDDPRNRFLLGLDPGLSTGWAYGYYSKTQPLTFLKSGVIKDGAHGFSSYWTHQTRNWFGETDLQIVVESFIMDGQVTGTWAPQIEGILIHTVPKDILTWQYRTDKATLFNQKAKGDKGQTERFQWLRDRGLAGVSHELDAMTHLLVYAKRKKHAPTIRTWWPKPE